MTWKGFAAAVLLAPVLALFAGVGALSWQIGQAWDVRATESLISAGAMVCLGSVALIGLSVAVPFAVLFAVRGFQGRQDQREIDLPRTQYRALPGGHVMPGWAQQPPQLEDKSQGDWQSMGPGAYDLWDAEPAAQRDWQEDW